MSAPNANRDRDLRSLRISLSGALFGFSASMLLWCLCTAIGANPLVPEFISDGIVIAGLVVIAVRARRVMRS